MRKFIPLVIVLGVATAGGLFFWHFLLEKTDSEPNVLNVDGRMIQVYQSQRCKLKTVISGDTIACQDNQKVKLCGVTANNSKSATAKLKELLQGRTVYLSPMSKEPTIAEVFTKISESEETFVNAEMVRSGDAVPNSQIDLCLGKSQILEAAKK